MRKATHVGKMELLNGM